MTEENNIPKQPGEFSTNAEWDMKSILLSQYAIAYNNLVDYIVEPDKHQLRLEARKSVLKLMYPLFTKLYILGHKWHDERNYIAYFMLNPDKLDIMELQGTFLILQRVLEKIGLTRFESYKLSSTEVYQDE